ncbi:MAG: GNAT family N-acetyltransferase [Actinomycetota bacterium]
MTLPDDLMDFWLAWYSLSPYVRRTDWGAVITDPRYPLIYDANQAGVLTAHDAVTADDVLRELTPALRKAGAAFEHVEFWDPPNPCPALEEIAARSEQRGWDVDMVFEADPTLDPSPEVEVREVDPLDDRVWAAHASTRQMFGQTLSGDVLEQMDRMAREVVVPAGLRIFAGTIGDELAGLVNLLSLNGVGYLDSVVTMPDFRRRGVATAIVLHVVERSLDGGDRIVHLLADEGDPPQRLYERLGFRVRARVGSATRRLETSDR